MIKIYIVNRESMYSFGKDQNQKTMQTEFKELSDSQW